MTLKRRNTIMHWLTNFDFNSLRPIQTEQKHSHINIIDKQDQGEANSRSTAEVCLMECNADSFTNSVQAKVIKNSNRTTAVWWLSWYDKTCPLSQIRKLPKTIFLCSVQCVCVWINYLIIGNAAECFMDKPIYTHEQRIFNFVIKNFTVDAK